MLAKDRFLDNVPTSDVWWTRVMDALREWWRRAAAKLQHNNEESVTAFVMSKNRWVHRSSVNDMRARSTTDAIAPFTLIVNNLFRVSVSMLASYLINLGCIPILVSLTWFLEKSEEFNQSDIPSDITALMLTLSVNRPLLWKWDLTITDTVSSRISLHWWRINFVQNQSKAI